MTAQTAGDTTRPPILAFTGLLVVALLPLAIAEPIPMVDLPNHLARAHIIANIDASPVLSQFYAIDWQFLPNLGIDLILPPLLKVFPHHEVTVALAAAIIALTAGGAVAIHHALFQRWSAFPLLAFFFLYSYSFLWGFLNFLVSFALALWLFYAWLKLRHVHPLIKVPLFAVLTTALAPMHLYGFAVYAVMVGTYEFSRVALGPVSALLRGIPTLAINALPFVPALVFILESRTADTPDVIWGTVRSKFGGLFKMFETYNLPVDLLAMAVFAAVFGYGLLTGRLVVHRMMILATVVLVALYFALPLNILGSGFVDLRMLPVIAIVGIAVSDWRVTSTRARRVLMAGFTGLFLVRMAVVALAWIEAGTFFDEVRSAFKVLEPGDRLAVAAIYREGEYPPFPPAHHIAGMAVVEQGAFANMLFSLEGAQPLRVIYDTDPAYRGCCAHEMQIDHGGPVPNPFERIPLADFDYLVVFGSDHLTATPPQNLSVTTEGDDYVLYRIDQPSSAGAPQ
ncbi:MAG: hypothetical protein AAF615_02720 [Pseudomonadota bacterium]